MAKRLRDNGPDPAVILATSFVFVGGLGACMAIIFASSADPRKPLLILAGSVAAFLFVFWLLGPKRTDPVELLVWLKRPAPKQKLKLRFSRHKSVPQDNTPKGPPTAESLRKLKEENNVWVRSKQPDSAPSEESSDES